MSADTKRPYDKAHLCAGLLTYGAKAYSNAAIRTNANAEVYYNADAYKYNKKDRFQSYVDHDEHECNHPNPFNGYSQNASAIVNVDATPH